MGTKLVPVLLVALLPLLCVCGGGGGGGSGDPEPPGPEAVLQGSYYLYGYTLTYPDAIGPGTEPDLPSCSWGVATADGAGSMDLVMQGNRDGEFDSEPGEGTLSYVVPSPGVLELPPPVGPGIPYLGGHVSPSGRFASVAKIVADEQPGILVFTRRGGTYSDASLDGAYVICGFYTHPVPIALFGGVSISSPGHGDATVAANVAGTPSGSGPVSLSYSISGNGDTSLDIGSLTDMHGGTVAGGDVVVVGGAAADGLPPALFAFVRGSTDRTLADFDGDYAIVGYRYDVSADAYLSATGVLTADGVGGYTTTLTVTDGETLWEDVAGGGTYDISAAGVLLLTNTLGDIYTGALSPDGASAVASGAINVGHDPAIYFLHR